MKSSLVFGVLVCLVGMVVVTEGIAYFRMKHINSGKVAEAYQDGYKYVRIWDRDDVNRADEQQWYVDSSSYGCNQGYFLRNKKYSTLVLSVFYNDWAAFQTEGAYGETCIKRWYISGTIVKNLDEDHVLTLEGGDTTNGNEITVKAADGSTDQDWLCDFS